MILEFAKILLGRRVALQKRVGLLFKQLSLSCIDGVSPAKLGRVQKCGKRWKANCHEVIRQTRFVHYRNNHYHLVRDRIAELERNAHGSGMVHVTKGVFESMPVAIPTDERAQAAIAHAIDMADSKQQLAVKHLATARRAIERFRRAVLTAACSGRLTTDWRGTHGAARTVERALAELSTKKRGRSDDDLSGLPLPDLPESYIVSTVRAASVALEYGTSKPADTDSAGVPVLRMGNIQDGRLDIADLKYCPFDSEISRLMLQDGDLLFNRTKNSLPARP